MDDSTNNGRRSVGILTSEARSLCNFRGPLISELISRGFVVYAIAPDFDHHSREKISSLGARPVDIFMSRVGRNPIADIWTFISLIFSLRKLRLDIVFCYYIKPVTYGMLAARIIGIPKRYALIAGAGYVFSDSQPRNILLRLIRLFVSWVCRRGLLSAEKVFFQNQEDLSAFVEDGLVSESKTVITGGTGVDLNLYTPAKRTTNPITFILVARLIIEKGILDYVEAARIVKEKDLGVRFILLGGLDSNPRGLTEKDVESWVNEGLLEWPGEVADVCVWLLESSVFVLPSYREGVPRSSQEAMAMGLPVITTDAVGCRDTVIHGKTGLIIPVRDPQSLVSAMMHFVQNPEDIKRMGDAGRRYAEEKFNVQKINIKILHAMGIK
jgi:glycosyltransferase involved in cell wall biosynthesis